MYLCILMGLFLCMSASVDIYLNVVFNCCIRQARFFFISICLFMFIYSTWRDCLLSWCILEFVFLRFSFQEPFSSTGLFSFLVVFYAFKFQELWLLISQMLLRLHTAWWMFCSSQLSWLRNGKQWLSWRLGIKTNN